jgi:hypothetical protein
VNPLHRTLARIWAARALTFTGEAASWFAVAYALYLIIEFVRPAPDDLPTAATVAVVMAACGLADAALHTVANLLDPRRLNGRARELAAGFASLLGNAVAVCCVAGFVAAVTAGTAAAMYPAVYPWMVVAVSLLVGWAVFTLILHRTGMNIPAPAPAAEAVKAGASS